MRDREKDAAEMALKRQNMLETGFRLFSEHSIDAVSMQNIADACGYGIATLYRYFNTKLKLVVEIGSLKWKEYFSLLEARRKESGFDDMTAKEQYAYELDVFLDLYDNHPDLLRFNQFFNIYVGGEHASSLDLSPYLNVAEIIMDNFHKTYRKGMEDHTLRSDISESEMALTTLHLMLAAVTRYAVGLVYVPKRGQDPKKELLTLKKMLLQEFAQ